jgi:hypothetical protein
VREQEALKAEKVVLIRDIVPQWEKLGTSFPCLGLGSTRFRRVERTINQQEQVAFFLIDNEVHYDNTP